MLALVPTARPRDVGGRERLAIEVEDAPVVLLAPVLAPASTWGFPDNRDSDGFIESPDLAGKRLGAGFLAAHADEQLVSAVDQGRLFAAMLQAFWHRSSGATTPVPAQDSGGDVHSGEHSSQDGGTSEQERQETPANSPFPCSTINTASSGSDSDSSSSSSSSGGESSSESSSSAFSSSSSSDSENDGDSGSERSPADRNGSSSGGGGGDRPRGGGGNDGNDDGDSSDSSSDSSDAESDDSDKEEPQPDEQPEEPQEKPKQEQPQDEKVEQATAEPDNNDGSSSDSDNDSLSEVENAYPELPPAPVDALISLRRRAKHDELKLSNEAKDKVVALARQHERDRRLHRSHHSKKTKKTNGVSSKKKSQQARSKNGSDFPTHIPMAVVSVSAMPTNGGATGDETWMVDCSCGLRKANYDDGSPMIQCDSCSNWVHAACAGKPPAEAANESFLCFRCTWIFDCVCEIRKRKNHDDGLRMVECESCNTWQHTHCVGIPATEEPPEHYRCPRCKKRGKRKLSVGESADKHHKSGGSSRRRSSSKSEHLSASAAALALTDMVGMQGQSGDRGQAPADSEHPAPPLSPPPSSSAAGPPPPPPSTPPPPSAPPPSSSQAMEVDNLLNRSSHRKRGRLHHGHRSVAVANSSNDESLVTPPPPPPPPSALSPLVVRPPLPSTPKSPAHAKAWGHSGLHASANGSGKRKSGSARDRLEKKLKLKKSSR